MIVTWLGELCGLLGSCGVWLNENRKWVLAVGLCYRLYSDTWIVKSGHLMELLKSADTWSGRLSRLCHCHGDVLGVVEMKGCQGESLGSLRVCWKRYTAGCCPIKKCEPAREKKAECFCAYCCACGCRCTCTGVLACKCWFAFMQVCCCMLLVCLFADVLSQVNGVLWYLQVCAGTCVQ